VDPKEIGVISIYRAQIKAIQSLLHGRPSIEMHTADRFQGRDKDCIIISLVRSNEKDVIGDLLKDWRRINVAFTRARTKLIILGSKSTLQSDPLLSRFIEMMEEKNWVYNLPPEAHTLHTLPNHEINTASIIATTAISPRKSPLKKSQNPKSQNNSPLKKSQTAHVKSPLRRVVFDLPTLKSPNLQKKKKGVYKKPPKYGLVSNRAILATRPVLRDIVNDAAAVLPDHGVSDDVFSS